SDLLLTGAPPLTTAFAVMGIVNGPTSFKGGTLVPVPWILFTPLTTDATGQISVPGIDRKSTRLNSSHVAISYAVFCLRKNKSQLQSCRLLVCRLLLGNNVCLADLVYRRILPSVLPFLNKRWL